MTNEEIVAFQKKERAFMATPVGAAFHKFKNALIRAWVLDTEDSCNDKTRKSTKDAHATAIEAERELRALIEK